MQGLVISGCRKQKLSPVWVSRTAVKIHSCIFTNNSANWDGGALGVINSLINITNTSFVGNSAAGSGAVDSRDSQLTILRSFFINNTALQFGGGIGLSGSIVHSSSNVYWNNRADMSGGAVHTYDIKTKAFFENDNFCHNQAPEGSAFSFKEATFTNCNFTYNGEGSSVVNLQDVPGLFMGSNIFIHNYGCIYAENSQISFVGRTQLINNTNAGNGGAIRGIGSKITFENSSETVVSGNTAEVGGGIYLRESTLSISGDLFIVENVAKVSGGGIYAHHSSIFSGENLPSQEPELKITRIHNNTAKKNGGGVYLFASVLNLFDIAFSLRNNTVEHYGGGMFLESNSVIKMATVILLGFHIRLECNSAMKGGGIYVVDVENSHCIKENENTCFLQASHNLIQNLIPAFPLQLIFFVNNTATETGSDIYGGLLDRCSGSKQPVMNGLQLFQTFSNFNWAPYKEHPANISIHVRTFGIVTNVSEFYNHISSDPVRVCFCEDDVFNCSSTHPRVFKKKGESFTLSLIATDQVGKPLNATIISSLNAHSGEIGRLKAGQQYRQISDRCTKLELNVYSSGTKAALEIYADGPCRNQGISGQEVNITFLPCVCPMGFERGPSDIDCSCDCDKRLTQHISDCSTENGTIQVNNNVWIKYINFTNSTSEYITHHCPFDYCVEKPVTLSLTDQDAQCAFNRTGTLCGECDEGLSLVFASSECQQCSNYYLFLLLPFAIAGITLVAFILILNMTVATGTIHGLIFYANILAANRSIFLPFDTPNFLTVFISWLNLDLGIQTCFYSGMDSYGKAMLQLVFPVYVFVLIAIIIVLCEYSQRIANLLGKKNPEATLYTLVLLSYSKLIRLIITALQFTTINYPDGTQDTIWLYDANVLYFSASHIPRLIAAIIITLLGTVYTILLLFGQLFNHCSEYRVMKWTTHKYYIHFMKAHHAPLSDKHRYWVGLLLLARLAHYLISAF